MNMGSDSEKSRKGGKRLIKKPLSKGKKRLLIFALVLYLIFAVTRYSKDTTYIPLTGRIFDIEVTEDTWIRAATGTGGQIIWEGEETEEIVELLNDLRYWWWFPEIPVQMGGWSYAFRINHEWYDVTGDLKWIEANGIYYRLWGNPLEEVFDRVEAKHKAELLLEEQQRQDSLNWE